MTSRISIIPLLILLNALFSIVAAETPSPSSSTASWKSSAIDPKKVIYAINCGSKKSFKSKHGFIYEADKYYDEESSKTGSAYTLPNIPKEGFKYTEDDEIHRNERYGFNGDLVYSLPISTGGDYVLILQFSDVSIFFKPLASYSRKKQEGFSYSSRRHNCKRRLRY